MTTLHKALFLRRLVQRYTHYSQYAYGETPLGKDIAKLYYNILEDVPNSQISKLLS